MTTLLLEIFSDEIPARMQVNAMNSLNDLIIRTFKESYGIDAKSNAWVTPRRLGFHFTDIPSKIDAISEEVRGPKTSAPEAALNGFLGKYNAKKEDLEVKGDYYSLMYTKPAVDIKEAIKNTIEQSIKKFVWPKSMKWGDFQETWVRPIHSILCLFGHDVIPVTYGDIVASNTTKCHRFMDGDKVHHISSYDDYQKKMEAGKVVLDVQTRKDLILAGVQSVIKDKKLKLINDEDLLNEIAGLVEFPHVLLGSIDSKLMHLPRELLIITLKHHQRYLMLENTDGTLAPYYIIVSNIVPSDNGQKIVEGNNKVLRARLADALFFYENDKKVKLEARLEKLKKLTFHQELGTVYDKTQSTLKLAEQVAKFMDCSQEKVKRAVMLAKADLVTDMVKEFPELQGVMGYYYALNDLEDSEVAIAIADQYKPVGPNDSIPGNAIGKVLAVSDKLDTMNQLFGIGIKPTGSKDPFALRRAANGILRIIGEDKIAEFFDILLKNKAIRDDVVLYIQQRNG